MKISDVDIETIIGKLNFRHEKDTVIAVLQDYVTKQVLMVGSMNREALRNTLRTGLVHFWSLTRNSMWLKGETSGNYQEVQSISIDCDSDAVLIMVKPRGPVCHTGNYSCFFTDIKDLKNK